MVLSSKPVEEANGHCVNVVVRQREKTDGHTDNTLPDAADHA